MKVVCPVCQQFRRVDKNGRLCGHNRTVRGICFEVTQTCPGAYRLVVIERKKRLAPERSYDDDGEDVTYGHGHVGDDIP